MRGILRRAASRIAGGDSHPFAREIARQIERRLTLFRYRLFELRHGHGWRRHVFRAARGMARLARRS